MIMMCILVIRCVALPIIMGAWLTAVLLGQRTEYNYSVYNTFTSCITGR